jgi:putative membrane protein
MHFGEWGFLGMHVLWWLFWIALIVVFFALIEPLPRGRRRDTPLELLQRRYAAGEITEKEYEERKRTLERDVRVTK